MAMSDDRFGLSKPEFLKLKWEFERMLKECATTEVRESPGVTASTIRNRLQKSGWAHVIKTNDQIEHLARSCGLDLSVYDHGSGKLLIIRDKHGQPLGRSVSKTPDALNRKAYRLFGFDLGTKKNIAAGMYLRLRGRWASGLVEDGRPMASERWRFRRCMSRNDEGAT